MSIMHVCCALLATNAIQGTSCLHTIPTCCQCTACMHIGKHIVWSCKALHRRGSRSCSQQKLIAADSEGSSLGCHLPGIQRTAVPCSGCQRFLHALGGHGEPFFCCFFPFAGSLALLTRSPSSWHGKPCLLTSASQSQSLQVCRRDLMFQVLSPRGVHQWVDICRFALQWVARR